MTTFRDFSTLFRSGREDEACGDEGGGGVEARVEEEREEVGVGRGRPRFLHLAIFLS